MNIECGKIVQEMDKSEDEFIVFPENYDTASHLTFFIDVNWRKKIVNTDSFFEVTNIRKMCKTILQILNVYFFKWYPGKHFSTNR